MAMKTTFFVQQFVLKRNKLASGDRDVALSEDGAMKRASTVSLRVKGAVAFKIIADGESGKVSEATVLSQHGDVPQNFTEQIKGG